MDPEIRIVRIAEALGRYGSGALSCLEAAEVLGMSERHFRRLRDRYEAEGAAGLVDRRLGRASGRRAPLDQIEWVLEQYRTRYWDFTAKHFHEHLVRDHGFRLGYTWTKIRLQEAGLVKKARGRGAHRKRRPRRALPGMLLFQDGSPHRWLVDLGRDLDLIATMNDATGEVVSAFLVEEEGTFSSFRGLRETIEKKGLFCAFYTDRGSHYFHSPKAGGKVDKGRLTQVGRALVQLGIEHIPSYSPEARMLGFEVSEAAVSKYMPRHPKPPSQTWRTFLENHVGCLASTDFFVVPTATFSLLFMLVVLRHERRRIVHIGTTAHPTAAWVAQQIREAFPWETAPRYMIRDRDRVYGIAFRSRIKAMGIEEVVTAPRSPWQSPYVERVIGSIRRECLDHVIVLNERHLRAILLSYIDYYQRSRTHLALGKDTPERRSVQPAGAGKIVAFPQVGGLHHRYQRLAA